MTDTCRALDRYVDQAPTVFRLKVAISEAEMAMLRRSFLPGESATQAIRRLALAKAQEVGR